VSSAVDVLAASPGRSLLLQLELHGFTLAAAGDRIRIRPSSQLTPHLRAQIKNHRADLLLWLNRRDAGKNERREVRPVAMANAPLDFVTLKGGLSVPRPALEFTIDLERRGIPLATDQNHQFIVPDDQRLRPDDLVAIQRWRLHLGAIIEYELPEA